MKTFVSVLLALALILMAVPFIATAESELSAYDTILAALYLQEEDIDISAFDLSVSELYSILDDIHKNEPMLYYWSGRYSYSYYFLGKPVEVSPIYTISAEERIECDAYINSALDAVIATVPEGIDDFEKALYLHDYVCLNFEYDLLFGTSDIYKMLLRKKAVCTGYALLYDELLSRVGIESRAVVSPLLSLNHMWNQVLIYGNWFHVDTTWDDPVPNRFGEARHTNFLLSDSEMMKTHNRDYIAENGCECALFDDKPWHSYDSAFVFARGGIYALDYDTVKRVELKTDIETEMFCPEKNPWYAIDGSYRGICVGLGGFKDRIYFNDNHGIYVADPSGTNRKKVLAVPAEQGQVMGMYIFGNTLYYLTSLTGYREHGIERSIELEYAEDVGGDANGDGTLDQYDYIFVKRIFFNTIKVDESQRMRADVNKDASLDQYDYILIRRAYFGTYTFK